METNSGNSFGITGHTGKVIISLAISLIGTILFIYVGVRLLGFFMPFVCGMVHRLYRKPAGQLAGETIEDREKTGISADHHPGCLRW